jgi:hypothetical protein
MGIDVVRNSFIVRVYYSVFFFDVVRNYFFDGVLFCGAQ